MERTRRHQQHANRVTLTEEDFINLDVLGESFLNTLHHHQNEQVYPKDMKLVDDYEPLPVDIEYRNGIISTPSDMAYAPGFDFALKWPSKNPIVTAPNTEAVSEGEKSIRTAQLSILEDLKFVAYEPSQKVIKEGVHWVSETEITDKDVICERGGKSNRHVGTKRYRGLIEKYKPEYQSLTAKSAKTSLSKNIISQIQNNGGRFLKKDDANQEYFILSPVETTKKVSQALREKKILKWTDSAQTAQRIGSCKASHNM